MESLQGTVQTTGGSSTTAAACHACNRTGISVCLWKRLTGDTTAGQGSHFLNHHHQVCFTVFFYSNFFSFFKKIDDLCTTRRATKTKLVQRRNDRGLCLDII